MTETKVLFRPQDHTIPTPAVLTFTVDGFHHRVTAALEIVPALASVPCEGCAMSTRDVMMTYGIMLPANDMEVNALEEFTRLSSGVELCDPGFVFVIQKAVSLEIEDLNAMTLVTDKDFLARIDTILQKLIGHAFCDVCGLVRKEFLEKLLSC